MAESAGNHPVATAGEPPLCVDLDGTLVASDTLWEGVILLVKQRPLDALQLPLWLAGGKAAFKDRIAQRVVPDAARLPYVPSVLELLRQQKQAGRRLVLTTASNRRMADQVASHLGLFDDVLCSDDVRNLGGTEKLEALRKHLGDVPFDYIGNSMQDVPLWGAARRAYVVNANGRTLRCARGVCSAPEILAGTNGGWRPIARVIRPVQWMKNILLFVPLVTSHTVNQPGRVLAVITALAAFSFCGSAVYVLNDLLDIESDRQHHSKRRRPLAAGTLAIPTAIFMVLALLITAFAIAGSRLPWRFSAVLATYFFLSTAYSFELKRRLLLDVMLLAGLYTLRIIAGALAISVTLTPWILAFSMFLFLSLAFLKRYSELRLIADGVSGSGGRGYRLEDMRIIESVGPTSGYLAVLVFAMYISSDAVHPLYRRPEALWLICPLMLYWITRLWFFAVRRAISDDPVIFALTDRVSLILGFLIAVLVAAAAI